MCIFHKFDLCLLHSTEELKRQASSLEAAQADLLQVQAQLTVAQADMENIKEVATVSESTKQEAIDQVKQQWQEEVISLQAIMKGNIGNGDIRYTVFMLLMF